MAGKKWQALEKAIATLFNTVRTPFSGSNSGITASDSLHDEIFVECKCHQNQAVLTLMWDTEKKAKLEGKIPLVALEDPTDEEKRKYILINVKDLKSIVREIDTHVLDNRIPKGTTIEKLLAAANSEATDLLTIKDKIQIQIKSIMREKIISKERLERIQALSTLIYFIDTIMDYLNDTTNTK